jgi:hypothetical protein
MLTSQSLPYPIPRAVWSAMSRHSWRVSASACSLTCSSWYNVAPAHHSITMARLGGVAHAPINRMMFSCRQRLRQLRTAVVAAANQKRKKTGIRLPSSGQERARVASGVAKSGRLAELSPQWERARIFVAAPLVNKPAPSTTTNQIT